MVDYAISNLKSGELSGSGPRRKIQPSLFVAYSFRDSDSQNFRKRIQHELSRVPSLKNVRVLDGKVPPGESWSPEIRNRLKKSNLVIADFSSINPEVVFECGFATGCDRSIIPVTDKNSRLKILPRWLKSIQVGHFSCDQDWSELIDSLPSYLYSKRKGTRYKTSLAIPGKIITLKNAKGNDTYLHSLEHFSTRNKMDLEIISLKDTSLDAIDDSICDKIASASLFIADLGGVHTDSFIHFAAGMVVGKPQTGVGKKRLPRRAILVLEDMKQTESLIPESARQVKDIIQITSYQQIGNEIDTYGKMFAKWNNRLSKE